MRVVDNEPWSGHHPMHEQPTHNHADHHIGRDAQAKKRNEARLGGGIVGAFGTGQPFNRALAEALGMPRDALFHDIAGKARNQFTTARGSEEHTSELQSLIRNSYA